MVGCQQSDRGVLRIANSVVFILCINSLALKLSTHKDTGVFPQLLLNI